jgi:predicted nucleic acid-binding protein
VIRFWDTSALVKIYSPTEHGHRDAVKLLHGPRARRVRQATSMIAAVELVSALVRRTRDRELASAAIRQLEAFSQIEFNEHHRNAALRLALSGIARGADSAIAAQVLAVAGAFSGHVDFLTADVPQARLVQREARARRLELGVVILPA